MHDHDDHDDIDALALPDRPPEDAPILVLLAHLARMWWRSSRWHWTTVRDTGITRYQVNGRGERRVSQRPGGYQPIDRHWLETGEWDPRPSRVRALTALVNGAREAEPSGQSSRAMWANINAARAAVASERGRTSPVPARPFSGVTAAEASENIARAFAACPSVRPSSAGRVGTKKYGRGIDPCTRGCHR